MNRRTQWKLFTLCVTITMWCLCHQSNVQMSFSVSEDKIDALINMIFYEHFIDFMCTNVSRSVFFRRSTRTEETYQFTKMSWMHVAAFFLVRVAPMYSQRPVSHSHEIHCNHAGFSFVCIFCVVSIVSLTTQALMNMPHWSRNRFVFIIFIRK